jgi:hypothetical protein
MGQAAHVFMGYLYAYGFHYMGSRNQWVIARVPLDQAHQRNAWSFYVGNGQWSPEWQQAVPVISGCLGTVHWNWYVGKFVNFCNLFSSTLFISTADRPEGPWSRLQEIHLGRQPIDKDHGIWMVISHPEISKERGRMVYVTYQQGTGMFRSETRLVELTFK